VLKQIVYAFKNVRLIAPIGVFRGKKSKVENKNEEDLIKVGNKEVLGELIGEIEYLLDNGRYMLRRVELVDK